MRSALKALLQMLNATPAVPETPTGLAVTGLTDGAVWTLTPTFTWDAVEGADTYEVEWGVAPLTGVPTVTGITDLTTTAVTPLTDYSQDKVQIRSRNAGGVSAWSSAVDFGVSTLAGRLIQSGEYWNLDESSTGVGAVTRAAKVASSRNLTDAAGTPSRTGKFSNAADFEGTADYLWTANDSLLQIGDSDFTVTGWVYLDTTNINKAVLGKSNGNWFNKSTLEWSVICGSGGTLALTVAKGTTGYTTSYVTAGTGAWHFFAAWHDSVNDVIGIQVDNATPVTLAHSLGLNATTERFRVSDSFFFDGAVDDICFFKGYVLTQTERDHVRNGGTGRTYPFLA